MLTAIREKATGWIAWVIAIIITVPMALWGINSYFEGVSEIAVATVNDEEISFYTYQDDLQQQRQILSQRLGSNFDPELLDSLGIRQRVVDNLINNRLLAQYTAENNFRISDTQLQELIRSYPSFQVDGQFNLAQYEAILHSNGFSPQAFEQYQRTNEATNQLLLGISETGFVTPEEQEKILALQTQQRKAQYAVLSQDSLEDAVSVSEDEINAYYEANKDRYDTEERMKVDFIELSVESLGKGIAPTETDILEHYEETKGKYRTAPSRKASHILVAAADSLSEEERTEKRTLAEDLLARAQGGEDFAALAEEYSDDPGSGRNGGDLGIVTRGQMVKPFEDAVFSMEEGDIEGVVETNFGFHIIKLTELREGDQRTLEEVRDQIVEELAQIQAENLFADLAESFKNLVFEDPDNITTAADALDLEVQQSDWFTQNSGEGVFENPQVRRAAFQDDVREDGLVSNAVEIGFDQLIAVQKSEYEPVSSQPLDAVRDQVEEAARLEKIQSQLLESGTTLTSGLETQALSIEQWQTEMSEQGLEFKDLPSRRIDYQPSLVNLAEAVFSAPHPDNGNVSTGGVVLSNGDYAVFSVQEVTNGSIEDADDAIKTSVEARVLARDGSELYTEFLGMLRDNAEVVVFEEQL